MFAVLKTGGKQYRVEKDDVIRIERLVAEEGEIIKLEEILMVGDSKKPTIGTPFVKGAFVEAEVIAQKRAPKIIVFKKKRRQNYRRKKGHKQQITLLRIKDIKAA